jgi:hypothetical protein
MIERYSCTSRPLIYEANPGALILEDKLNEYARNSRFSPAIRYQAVAHEQNASGARYPAIRKEFRLLRDS